jgi:hypothetical protein
LNPKCPPKYKNPLIWAKFGFQVDYGVVNWYPSLVCYGGHFESKMAAKMQNPPIGTKFGFQVDYGVANWYPSLVVKLSMVSDFNKHWYLGVFWSEELVGNDETCIHMPEFWYRVAWGLLCLHPNTIEPSYYYYSSSSSSRRDFVRTNSQRLMIRSLLNFTERWIPISRGAFRSWNFQNGRRCHGNREHMSKSLTSLL